MKKILIDPSKKQYRANLHCHTTVSDGKLSHFRLTLTDTNAYFL